MDESNPCPTLELLYRALINPTVCLEFQEAHTHILTDTEADRERQTVLTRDPM